MIKFVVVDDDKIFVDKISYLLKNNSELHEKINIYGFTKPIEFLKECEKNIYDVVFLDIDMPEMNGFELSKKLRKLNSNILIIFITSTSTPIDVSLKFRPIGFIRKNNIETSFQNMMQIILEELNIIKKELILFNREQCYKIRYIDIVLVQSNGNNIEIFTNKGKISSRKTIKSIKSELEFNGFVNINKGLYVNISKINYISYTNLIVQMTNGTQFPISRLKIKNIKEAIANEL